MIKHVKAIEDWVNSEEMRQKDFSTRRRYSTDIKGLYLHHHIRMPRVNISKVAKNNSVEFNVTATQYLEMATKAFTPMLVSICGTAQLL